MPSGPAVALSSDIAAWGDSLMGPAALNLGVLLPNRTVYDGGVVGQTSSEIAARALADAGMTGWINVFWYGMNNEDEPEVIKADIARSVSHLAANNQRFVVMSVVNQDVPEEVRGGALYATILQLNAELAALYPAQYLDIRAYLVAQYDPSNAQDVADFQQDVVPSSLRFPNDVIHLNNDGSVLVAKRVRDFIEAKGW